MKQLQIDLTRPATTALSTANSHSTVATYRADPRASSIVEQYRALIVWRPEGGGPSEAVRVPTTVERGVLEVRTRELGAAMRSASMADADKRRIGAALARMFGGFPSLRNADAQGMIATYVMELQKLPAWAVERACEAVRESRVEGLSLEFPPTAPRMFQIASTKTVPLKVEEAHIAEVLALQPRDGISDDEKARVREGFQGLASELRARSGVQGAEDENVRQSIVEANRSVFVRECEREGIDPARGVSPALLKTLGAHQ